ncbi:CHAD domain containing protein [Deinococcus proteolyticus MRP]|uniref:CHAD domain containing protein n=1 Tax=Deinococcus proteolyticus (strain ATCC 35074 / DSM 20540 / JCM 6276 / NBRC 101906 / NCIMB 13154 / VKM Ac-1939 / CCM 2703 / MRP) TaxID=693977 RepID=F0RLN3_DEIPM|nr:CHAD domain-containing protein [Deinococcus proteolyticus]ADY26957.1 CHAD domain containing protein [Deinococcus proteolyticus MRP]
MAKTSSKATKAGRIAPASGAQPSTLNTQLAEYWPDFQAATPRAVHEVRKLTRRAGAEAEVSDLKKKVRREWRDLRRAAAPIRDHDAAGEHLQAALAELKASPAAVKRFQAAWAKRRTELLAAHPLPAAMPSSYDLPGDWEARAERVMKADRKALLKRGKALMKAADTDDSEAWHDWRKLMKRYRYTLELAGKAPREVKDTLEHLGRLQDAEVLLELLRHEGQHFTAAQLSALTRREEQARLQARAAVRELWPTLKAHLKGEALPNEEAAPPAQAPATAEASAPAKVSAPATPAASPTPTKKAATPKPDRATQASRKTPRRQPAAEATGTQARAARSGAKKTTPAAATKAEKAPAKRASTAAAKAPAAKVPASKVPADKGPAKRAAKTAINTASGPAAKPSRSAAKKKPATPRRKTGDPDGNS